MQNEEDIDNASLHLTVESLSDKANDNAQLALVEKIKEENPK